MAEIIVALDFPTAREALGLVDRLGDRSGAYKVGLELFTAEGASMTRALEERKKRIFLDLKLHDIPNTVAGAVRTAADHGVDLLTVHTSGGRRMMTAAAEAGAGRIHLLGVTILTSLTTAELEATWDRSALSLEHEVGRLAAQAQESGLDGVVSSPLECRALKDRLGEDFLVVTPGIRPSGSGTDDQARIATPRQAVEAGSDYLVVGRAVTAAPDPESAFSRIFEEVRETTEEDRS